MSNVDDDLDSLFGSPPASPTLTGKSSNSHANELALPGTRTSNNAASVFNNSHHHINVGTTALPGLHQIFDTNNPSAIIASSSSDTVEKHTTRLSSRPPALQPQNVFVTAPATSTLSSTRGKKRSTKSSSRASTPSSVSSERQPRPLARPLDLAEGTSLRSHPSLLGVAGNIAGVAAAGIRAPGTCRTNPIVLDQTVAQSSVASGSKFRPRFKGEVPPPVRRPAIRNQHRDLNPLTALEVLCKAIIDRITADTGGSSGPSPLLVLLKQSRRFQALINDLVRFTAALQSPQDSVHVRPAPKRRRTRHGEVPAGAEYWNVPFPFAEGDAPNSYHEKWKRDNTQRLLKEFVSIMRCVQKAMNKENYWKAKPRKQKSSTPNTRDTSPTSFSASNSVEPLQESTALGATPTAQHDTVAAWLEALDNAPTPASSCASSDVDMDEVWRILGDMDSWSILNAVQDPSSLSSSDTTSNIIPNPLSLDDVLAAPTDSSNALPNELIDPAILNDHLRFDMDLDTNSSYTGGTEEIDAFTSSMTMSPSSSFGVLPTPTTTTATQTPSDSPRTPLSVLPDLDAIALGYGMTIDGDGNVNGNNDDSTAAHTDVRMVDPTTLFKRHPPQLLPIPGLTIPTPPSSIIIPDVTLPPTADQIQSAENVIVPSGSSTTVTENVIPPPGGAAQPAPVRPIVLRKEAAIARAQSLRTELLQEIQRVNMELWEYTIEAGVLCNLANNVRSRNKEQ